MPSACAASSRLEVTWASVGESRSFSTSARGVPGRTVKVVVLRSNSRRKSGQVADLDYRFAAGDDEAFDEVAQLAHVCPARGSAGEVSGHPPTSVCGGACVSR